MFTKEVKICRKLVSMSSNDRYLNIPNELDFLAISLKEHPQAAEVIAPEINSILNIIEAQKETLESLKISEEINVKLHKLLSVLGEAIAQKDMKIMEVDEKLSGVEHRDFCLEFASILPPFRISDDFKEKYCKSGLINNQAVPGMLPYALTEVFFQHLGSQLSGERIKFFREQIKKYVAVKDFSKLGKLAQFFLSKFNVKDFEGFFERADNYVLSELGRNLEESEKQLLKNFLSVYLQEKTMKGESKIDKAFKELKNIQKKNGELFSDQICEIMGQESLNNFYSENFFLLKLLNEGIISRDLLAKTLGRRKADNIKLGNYKLVFDVVKFEVSGVVDRVSLGLKNKDISVDLLKQLLGDFLEECTHYQNFMKTVNGRSIESTFIGGEYERLEETLKEFLQMNKDDSGTYNLRHECHEFLSTLRTNTAHLTKRAA